MFDLVSAIARHRATWDRHRGTLRAYYDAINRSNALCFDDWELIFKCLEEFRPMRIIELGRCLGNSTMLFCDYCGRHGATLTSLDWDNAHFELTLKRLADKGLTPPTSLATQDILTMNILDWTPPPDAPPLRTLLYVDAHGEDVGRHVVEKIVLRLRQSGEPLLMIAHDVVDLRHETLGPQKFDMKYRWGHFASMFSEILELKRLWDQFGVQSAADALRQVTGRGTAIDDGVGFCAFFTTCVIPPAPTRRTALSRPGEVAAVHA